MIKYLVNNNDLVEIYSDLLISHLYKKEEYGKTSDSDGNEVVVYTLATHHDPFSAVIFRVIVKHDADHFYTFNIYTDSLKKEYKDLDVGTPFLNNFNKRLSNFSQRLMKCFSFIYHVRLTDRNDKSKSVSIDNLEAGSWQEAVDKVITDHPEFGLKPGDYEGSDKVEVHWNYGENTLKSF